MRSLPNYLMIICLGSMISGCQSDRVVEEAREPEAVAKAEVTKPQVAQPKVVKQQVEEPQAVEPQVSPAPAAEGEMVREIVKAERRGVHVPAEETTGELKLRNEAGVMAERLNGEVAAIQASGDAASSAAGIDAVERELEEYVKNHPGASNPSGPLAEMLADVKSRARTARETTSPQARAELVEELRRAVERLNKGAGKEINAEQ